MRPTAFFLLFRMHTTSLGFDDVSDLSRRNSTITRPYRDDQISLLVFIIRYGGIAITQFHALHAYLLPIIAIIQQSTLSNSTLHAMIYDCNNYKYHFHKIR